jgi:hypothetical protein
VPNLWERLTGLIAPDSTPPPPASRVKASRDQHAADLDLDTLCKVMRPRALAFARAYLSAPNATEAARRAGYGEGSIRKTAVRLLRDPYVRRYIELARVEAAIADRANLAALKAQLWLVATGQPPTLNGPTPTPAERSGARAQLARLEVALAGGEGQREVGDVPKGKGPSGEGWNSEALADFDRAVLGVELDGEEPPATG